MDGVPLGFLLPSKKGYLKKKGRPHPCILPEPRWLNASSRDPLPEDQDLMAIWGLREVALSMWWSFFSGVCTRFWGLV